MESSQPNRLKTKKYRFHYIGMAHLPVAKLYSPCAFTQKIHNLTKMLLAQGHEVFLYGAGYTDIKHKNLTFIPVVSLEDLRSQYGVGDNRFELGYNWHEEDFKHDINSKRTPVTQRFIYNCIRFMNENRKDDDFLLNPQGTYYKEIADNVSLFLTCEPGIGYRGSYSKYRAFESSYIQNFTYGSEAPYASLNGYFYHRVIPNYYDPKDFPISEYKADYLLYVGRVTPRKGVEIAMRVAEALDKPLLIAGQGSLHDIPYKYKGAKHIGIVNVEQRAKLMSEALVTLTPSRFIEPFCGVAVESMMCGTPVVSTNYGAFLDTVQNGVSGYRCDTLQDFVEATEKAIELGNKSSKRITAYAKKRYSTQQVGKLYSKWFDDLYAMYIATSTNSEETKGWYQLNR